MTDRVSRCLAIADERDQLQIRLQSLNAEEARLMLAMSRREELELAALRHEADPFDDVTVVVSMTDWPPR